MVAIHQLSTITTCLRAQQLQHPTAWIEPQNPRWGDFDGRKFEEKKSHLLEVLLGFPRFRFGCLAKATSAKAGRLEKPRQPRPIGMIFRELFVPTWMMCWLVAMQQCILSPTECWSAASTLAKHARWCCSASRTRSAFHLKVSCQQDLHLPYRLDSTLPWRFP